MQVCKNRLTVVTPCNKLWGTTSNVKSSNPINAIYHGTVPLTVEQGLLRLFEIPNVEAAFVIARGQMPFLVQRSTERAAFDSFCLCRL